MHSWGTVHGPDPGWGASVPPELLKDTKPELTARPTLAFLPCLGTVHLHFSSCAMQCFASIRHPHPHLKAGERASAHHLLPPDDVHGGKIHRDIGNFLASISWGHGPTSATKSHPAESKEWGLGERLSTTRAYLTAGEHNGALRRELPGVGSAAVQLDEAVALLVARIPAVWERTEPSCDGRAARSPSSSPLCSTSTHGCSLQPHPLSAIALTPPPSNSPSTLLIFSSPTNSTQSIIFTQPTIPARSPTCWPPSTTPPKTQHSHQSRGPPLQENLPFLLLILAFGSLLFEPLGLAESKATSHVLSHCRSLLLSGNSWAGAEHWCCGSSAWGRASPSGERLIV